MENFSETGNQEIEFDRKQKSENIKAKRARKQKTKTQNFEITIWVVFILCPKMPFFQINTFE